MSVCVCEREIMRVCVSVCTCAPSSHLLQIKQIRMNSTHLLLINSYNTHNKISVFNVQTCVCMCGGVGVSVCVHARVRVCAWQRDKSYVCACACVCVCVRG